jgi:hypothetical protein
VYKGVIKEEEEGLKKPFNLKRVHVIGLLDELFFYK